MRRKFLKNPRDYSVAIKFFQWVLTGNDDPDMRLLVGGHVGCDAGVVSGVLGLRVCHEQSRLLVGANSAHLTDLSVQRIQPSTNTENNSTSEFYIQTI